MSRLLAVGLAVALLVVHQGLETGLRAQAVIAPDQAASAGVIVEAVEPSSSGAAAGIKPGDVLVSWSRSAPSDAATERGPLRSPFDLTETEVEQAPRGAVTLTGIRDRQALAVVMAPGPWGIASRPQMPPSLLATYEAGLRSLDAKAIEAATDLGGRPRRRRFNPLPKPRPGCTCGSRRRWRPREPCPGRPTSTQRRA